MNRRGTRTCWLLVLAAASLLRAEPLLKPGERLVFYGDSITEQRMYTKYVMAWCTLHLPDAAITFRNAGWSGDTAPGGLGRLQRDVLSLKPNVVSIVFGMNDGRYTAFNEGTYNAYMRGQTGLLAKLKDAGVKVLELSPGCVDPDKREHENGLVYNQTLTRFGEGVRDLAAKSGVAFWDLNKLMNEVQTKAKADNKSFTMIPDSVHPSAPGQAVMAFALLQGLGFTDAASGLAIDAAKGTATPDRCEVKDLKAGEAGLSFTRTDAALPAFWGGDTSAIYKYIPFQETLNRYAFTVTGLKAGGKWKLTVADSEVGTYTSEELAAGVNLATAPGPWQSLGRQVLNLCGDQENLYFNRWRNIGLTQVPAEAQDELKALLGKLDKLIDAKEAQRLAAPAQRTWAWKLTPAG